MLSQLRCAYVQDLVIQSPSGFLMTPASTYVCLSSEVPDIHVCLSLQLPPSRITSPWSRLRPISNSQLHTLLHFHLCPINLIVSKGTYFLEGMGDLILGGASRLDAFSVYPFHAWLPGYALGSPAGAPAARPARSSRTKASSPQISCAHAG